MDKRRLEWLGNERGAALLGGMCSAGRPTRRCRSVCFDRALEAGLDFIDTAGMYSV